MIYHHLVENSFDLHPSLAKKRMIIDLPLSRVLLEDVIHYPWIVLVPRRSGLCRLLDLEIEDQFQLVKESNLVQKILWDEFNPKQINVAAIGNKTPQLHLHVIARFTKDPAWPGTVWDHPERTPYPTEQKEQMIEMLKTKIQMAIK